MDNKPYITYHEYYDFGFEGFRTTEEREEFALFLKRASNVADSVTRNFYKFNDLEGDYGWRKLAFKKAVACQIEFFLEVEGFTTEAINNEPQSQQIGRIKISKTSRFNPKNVDEPQSVICPDIYMFLEGTGLLNRGIN